MAARRTHWVEREARLLWVAKSHSGNGVVCMQDWNALPQRLKNYWIRKARAVWDQILELPTQRGQV